MRKYIKNILRESLFNEGSNSSSYIMYHGTTHEITNFTDEFVGGKEATDQEGPGVYFTSSLGNAKNYGDNVYKVEITPKNPVSTEDGKNAPIKQLEWLVRQSPDFEDNAMNWHENPMIGYKIGVREIIKYNDNPHQQFLQVWIDFYRYHPIEYVRNMVKLGYDCIIINNLNSLSDEQKVTHIIVLDLTIVNFLNQVY